MSNATLGLPPDLHAYLLEVGVREPDILRELRAETASLPEHDMQIAPEQGALMALLAELIGARRYLEVGTFTGYSSLCIARGLPGDGHLLCCDTSEEWTAVARRYWQKAGVADRIELVVGPAVDTLRALPREQTLDLAFIDADKPSYPLYYEELLARLRPGGVILVDNVLWMGRVADHPAHVVALVDPPRMLRRAVDNGDVHAFGG